MNVHGIRLALLGLWVVLAGACAHLEPQPPVLIQEVPPVYPEKARQAGVEGRVIIEFLIDRDGVPRQLQVVEAPPGGWFEEAALEAVAQWRYRPATRLGRPVESPEAEAVLYFRLDPEAGGAPSGG